ncbi:MAG: M20/M25/M40 family metallo-hydrolase [Gemmatimonadota bacterium]
MTAISPRCRCGAPVLLSLLLAAAGPLHAQAGPPPIRFTTDEAFDAGAVPPYHGEHKAIYAHIDAHRAEHLAQLQRWVRQPSVSAEGRGITEMAALVRDDLRALGFREVDIVPTSGHPVVFGVYDVGAPKTILVYMMYDVQPVEPSEWRVPPFAGEVVETEQGKVLMARGATNQKGPERAFLNALESIIAVEKRLPVNLMVVAEGEEELASVHLPEFIEKHADRLKRADAVVFPFNAQNGDGSVSMNLGVKGILYFELEARGGTAGGPRNAEIHSSFKAIVDAPAIRLAQAIASLTTPDGNTILVPGYYDAIRPPTDEEQRLVNGMLKAWTAGEAGLQRSLGVDRWIDGLTGRDALVRYLFSTTLNVDGIWSGYAGPGSKTILPHKATAKLDSRLVPDQRPDDQLRLIRQHLDARGFSDIVIRKLGAYPAAQTSVSAPPAQAAIGVYRKYGLTPSVVPRLAGSAPYYLFTERLGLPMVLIGMGRGTGAHAPNEYMVIEPPAGSKVAALPDIEKAYVDFLYALR